MPSAALFGAWTICPRAEASKALTHLLDQEKLAAGFEHSPIARLVGHYRGFELATAADAAPPNAVLAEASGELAAEAIQAVQELLAEETEAGERDASITIPPAHAALASMEGAQGPLDADRQP